MTAIEDALVAGKFLLQAEKREWMDRPSQFAAVIASQVLGTDDVKDPLLLGTAAQFLCIGRWAISGFPVLSPTHRLAASLMATSLSIEAVQHARPRWPGVIVRVPSDLVYMTDDQLKRSVPISLLAFTTDELGYWAYSAVPESKCGSLWARQSAERMVKDDVPMETVGKGMSITDLDIRTSSLLRRLMFGVCLYLSDPSKLGSGRKVNPRRRSTLPPREARSLPDFSYYEIGKEISIDVNIVAAVRDFDLEGGRTPRVQSMVGGHWKSQPYGPGMSLRKIIHIEPYWRGPEGAPVLFRHGKAKG